MSSGYVAIPFVVDMNAARISAPWLGQLLSLVQQIGAAVSNRIVGRHRSAWPEARRTECEVFDIPRRDKDGWGFARSASRPQRSADAHLDLLACGAPANIRHSPDGAQAEVRRRWDYRPCPYEATRQNARRGPSRPPIPPQGATGAAYPRRHRLGARNDEAYVYRSHRRKRYRPGYSDRHCAKRPALDCQAMVNLSRRPILDLTDHGRLRTQSDALNDLNRTRTSVRLLLA